MSDTKDAAGGYELICVYCDARRDISARVCPNSKCADATGAVIMLPRDATPTPKLMRDARDYHASMGQMIWSRFLQRFVWLSEWTDKDMAAPETATPHRFPGNEGTFPENQNPKPPYPASKQPDLSYRFDLEKT
jgi:hypothetical protein